MAGGRRTPGRRPRGHEAVIVSHQLPIWITRLQAEGRSFLHDPRKRQCTLCSLTSFTFDGRAAGQRRLLRARRRPDPRSPTAAPRSPPVAPPRSTSRLRHLPVTLAACRVLPSPPCCVLLVVAAAAAASAGTGDKGYVDGDGHHHPARRGRRTKPGQVSGETLDGKDLSLATTPARSSCSTSGVVVPAVPQGGADPRRASRELAKRRRRLRRGEHQGLQPRAAAGRSSGATGCRTPRSSTRPDARCSLPRDAEPQRDPEHGGDRHEGPRGREHPRRGAERADLSTWCGTCSEVMRRSTSVTGSPHGASTARWCSRSRSPGRRPGLVLLAVRGAAAAGLPLLRHRAVRRRPRRRRRGRMLAGSFLFVLGFSFVFVSFGR